MSVKPLLRAKPVPRWSVVRLAGLAPRSMPALVEAIRMVWFWPPFSARGWRPRLAPNGRLNLLDGDRAKPLLTPMAVLVARTASPAEDRSTLALPDELPETIVLCKVIPAGTPPA